MNTKGQFLIRLANKLKETQKMDNQQQKQKAENKIMLDASKKFQKQNIHSEMLEA